MWQRGVDHLKVLGSLDRVFFFVVAAEVVVFAEVLTALFVVDLAGAFEEVATALRVLVLVVLAAVVFAVVDVWAFFARKCVAGASRTGSATASVRRGAIVVDERWFQRRRSSTETLKRSAIVTSVSPARVT